MLRSPWCVWDRLDQQLAVGGHVQVGEAYAGVPEEPRPVVCAR